MSEVDNNLSLQDLRAIIHGLKMSGFAFIEDEDTRYNITCMVSDLPCPEALLCMCEKPDELKSVREYVGEIMKLIDCGGSRDESFKIRYEAKKDMPPRYNVLKWRKSMNKKDMAKNLITASTYADEKGDSLLAEKAILIARKCMNGEDVNSDLNDLKASVAKSRLNKESQNWFTDLFDNRAKKDVKNRNKNDQMVLKSLYNITDLMKKDQYDTDKIRNMLQNMPESQAKQELAQYVSTIDNVENDFYNTVTEMSNRAQQYIDHYNQSGVTAPQAQPEAAPAEEPSSQPEAAPAEEPADQPAAQPTSEQPAQPSVNKIDQMNSREIYQLIMNPNFVDSNFAQELNEEGYKGKALGQLTDQEAQQMAKELGLDKIASSKHFNKTFGSKRWVRIAGAWDVIDNIVPDPNSDMFDPRVNVKKDENGQTLSPENDNTGMQSSPKAPAAPFAPVLNNISSMTAKEIIPLIKNASLVPPTTLYRLREEGYKGTPLDKLNDDQARQMALELGLDKKELTSTAKSVIFNKKASSNKWVRFV